MTRPASGPPPVQTCDEADNPAGQTMDYHPRNSPFQPPGWDIPVCLGAAVTNSGSGTRSRGLRERSAGAATTDPLLNYYGIAVTPAHPLLR